MSAEAGFETLLDTAFATILMKTIFEAATREKRLRCTAQTPG